MINDNESVVLSEKGDVKVFDKFIESQERFSFYGVCSNEFKLGGAIWEAIENPADGYRSYMDSIIITDSDGIFFSEPLAQVKVESVYDKLNGYRFIDVNDGHMWLEFGTEDYDDYYPYFVFRYYPKEQ